MNLTALVLEDDPDDKNWIIEMIQPLIRKKHIRTVSTLKEARDLVERQGYQPSVILADVFLPPCSAKDLFDWVSNEAAHIPVVVITGADNLEEIEQEAFGHVQDFICKRDLPKRESAPEMVARVASAIERFRNQRNMLALLNVNPDGLVIVNKKGTVRYHNPAAETMFTGKIPLQIGKSFSIPKSLQKEGDVIWLENDAFKAQETSLHWNNEECLLISCTSMTEYMQTRHDLEATNEQLHTANAELNTIAEELRSSNTELRDTTVELERARTLADERAKEADAANRMKSDFLANMSHELRTPLNALLVLAELMAKNESGSLSAEDQECAAVINESGKLLLEMINSILDLSKLDAHSVRLAVEPVLLAHILQIIEQRYRGVASKRGLSLRIVDETSLDQQILMDQKRVQQVLGNLIDNAIKFTREGSVMVRVRVQGHPPASLQLPQHDQWLEIAIQDTGIGMTAEQMTRIFEPFEQADSGITRNYGGTGLGLSICQKLVKLMEGGIELSSEPGQGTCFSVWLPMQYPEHSDEQSLALQIPEAENPQSTPGDNPGMKPEYKNVLRSRSVLLVESDMRNMFAIAALLQKYEVVVHKCPNARHALEILEVHHKSIDVILTDIMMPDMGGMELIGLIREDDRFAGLPIIACTAMAQPGDGEKIMQAGADSYITKPIDREQLIDLLVELLTN